MLPEEQQKLVHTPSQNSPDFPDFIEEWGVEFIKAKRTEGISTRTQEIYRANLAHFIRFCSAQVIEHISQITPTTIRDFLLWFGEDHNQGGVHAAYRVLKTFLRWYDLEAEPEGWRNPIAKVKAPRLSEEPLEPVELKTVQAMVSTCDDSFLGKRNKAIFLTLLDTGLRARELLSLNRADVNPVTGAVVLRIGKGRKARNVHIEQVTRKAVRAYLKQRTDDEPALFITDDRTGRLSYPGLRVVIKRHAKLAGVEEPTAHDFRRAFAINMLRNGVDLVTLARLMGHSSLKILQRYLKQVDQDLQEAHAKGSPVNGMYKGRGK